MKNKNSFLYLAYGSNMLTERLRMRCKSADTKGLAYKEGYELAFDKRSKKDGSGKATLVKNSKSKIYGVVFEILEDELGKLNQAEGKGQGYELDKNFEVALVESNKIVETYAYIATDVSRNKNNLKPYDWYRALVLAGAMQHNLPPDYIEKIRRIETKPDPKPERPRRQEALRLLRVSGYGWLAEGIA